jgi:thiamine biosynthesis lipoprotein ApbE
MMFLLRPPLWGRIEEGGVMLKKSYFICLLVSLLFLAGCAERTFRKFAFLLGTEVEITVSEKNAKKAKRAIELALKKIRDEEKNLSYYLASSELSRINQNAGKDG